MTHNYTLNLVNVSDVGLKRPHNEDSTLSDREMGLFILADGMGGYKAGEVASAIAVTSIYENVKQQIPLAASYEDVDKDGHCPHSAIAKNSIIHANSIIYNTATNDPGCQGMGTTVVVGLLNNDILSIAHVGDSRMYRLRGDTFEQLTKDHSLIQELIDRGFYTPEEAIANTPKNLVTRALGIDADVQVDVMEEQVLAGDIYLLCSDGLNDMVKDEEIHLTLSKYSANLAQAASGLVDLANQNGGKDNTSIILASIDVK